MSRVITIVLGVLLLAAGVAYALSGCAPSQRHVASDRIVSTGSLVNDMRLSNSVVYQRATDEMRESGLTGPAYDFAVGPLDREFDARVKAIAAAADALYTAARKLDATQDPRDPSVRMAAQDAADALEHAVDVLRDSHALPPVPIPRGVAGALDQLHALASGGAAMDGGLAHE